MQHHHTRFTTNAKGMSLVGKEKVTNRIKRDTNGEAHQ